MGARLDSINRNIKRFDSLLYAERADAGVISVFRRGYRFLPYDFRGNVLLVLHPSPHHIFSLTSNWTASGEPVEWGIEPILLRLRAIDAWNRERFYEKLEQRQKDEKEIERKRFRSQAEAFFADTRSEFKKAFNDVNTSTLH